MCLLLTASSCPSEMRSLLVFVHFREFGVSHLSFLISFCIYEGGKICSVQTVLHIMTVLLQITVSKKVHVIHERLFGNYFIVLVLNGLIDLPRAWCQHPCRSRHHSFMQHFHCLQVVFEYLNAFVEWVNFSSPITHWLFIQYPASTKHPEISSDFINKPIIRARQEPKPMRMYFQNPFALILHLLCRNEFSNPDNREFWQTGNRQRDNITWYQFLFLVSVLPSQNFFKDSIAVLPAMLG